MTVQTMEKKPTFTPAINSSRRSNSPRLPLKLYLFAFNAFNAFAWARTLSLMLLNLSEHDFTITTSLYGSMRTWLLVAQAMAAFEVLHAMLGFVRSPVGTVFVQVLSRVFILWGIVEPVPSIQNSWFVVGLIFSWGLAEVPRYVYYGVNLFNACPAAILWLRYSLFIVLYPLGISSEILCVWHALPVLRDTGMWSLPMPNALNLPWSYYYAVLVATASYVPGAPFMYTHMLRQRRKYLAADTTRNTLRQKTA